jgi:4-amino-4-deoxy-L-arabinose transferase-like glycosyltransferase
MTAPVAASIPLSLREGRIARAVIWLSATHRRAVLALALIAMAAFLPGFVSLQPMDRDEPRFAQASKQMLESGDLVDIRFQDDARHKKPVGIYWMQSATVAIAETLGVNEARTTISVYRLPSLAGAILMVLATYWAALAVLRPPAAFLAAALMAASILLGVEARLAKTDAMLSLCCTLAFGGLLRAYLWREQPLARATLFLFWGGVALGVLVKGPIIFMVAGLAALVLCIRDRSARWLQALRPAWGLLFVAAVVAPWFIAITLKSKGAFFAEAVGKDMLGKVGSAQEKHGAPPGFYFLAFFAAFWPGAALAALAVPFIWVTRRENAVAFCLAWIIPSWLIFELVPTKLPHYVLPLYPAIAILIVHSLCAGALVPARRGASAVAFLIVAIPAAIALLIAGASKNLDGILPFVSLPVYATGLGLAYLAWRSFMARDGLSAIGFGVIASLAVTFATFGLAQPVLQSLKLSPRLAAAAQGVACHDRKVVTAGYREPSLVFLTGTELAMRDGAGAAAFLMEGGCRVAFVTKAENAGFSTEAAKRMITPRLVTTVSGFNINGGKRLDIDVFAVTP